MAVQFDSTPFVRSHGKEPRGRGSYAFSLVENPDPLSDEVLFSPSGTYSEARAWARKRYTALAKGRVRNMRVFVLP